MKNSCFQEQLQKGEVGESLFETLYPEYQPRKETKDKRFDYILSHAHPLSTNLRAEIKTDLHETGNVFMEHHTDRNGQMKIGGPWRASDAGSDFIYICPALQLIMWYCSDALCEFLETSNYRLRKGGYNAGGQVSVGYVVPIEDLESRWLLLEKVAITDTTKTLKYYDGVYL